MAGFRFPTCWGWALLCRGVLAACLWIRSLIKSGADSVVCSITTMFTYCTGSCVGFHSSVTERI